MDKNAQYERIVFASVFLSKKGGFTRLCGSKVSIWVLQIKSLILYNYF